MVQIIDIAWLIANPILLILMVTQYLSLRRLTKIRQQKLAYSIDMTFLGWSGSPHRRLHIEAGTSIEDVIKKIAESDDCSKGKGQIPRPS